MHRRELLKSGCSAAIVAAQLGMGSSGGLLAKAADGVVTKNQPIRPALLRHRFGVHYAPPRSWFHIWNDFDADVVARDLDAIASLGADHLRMFWFGRISNRTGNG